MMAVDTLEFKKIYKENFTPLSVYIYSKCGDRALAEDIAQESFIRLWKAKEKVPNSKSRAFLFVVASNLFRDHNKHQKVKNNFCNSFEIKNDIYDPQYLVEMNEFKAKIEFTLQTMPDGAREVFLLSRMEKMTYVQIADALGLSVKTIEKRMHKALEIMANLKLK